jgi:serine protease Do
VVGANGAILTTSQLVFGADRVRVRLRDGTEYFASSVRMDPRSNVAVVQISPVGRLPALPLGDSDSMQVGDWVMALGRTSQLAPSAETGIVNGVGPGPGVSRAEDFFQTGTMGNLAGHGAPLLNLNGQVVGINASASNWDEELNPRGLAVPSNLVNWASRQLMDTGAVNRGFLGVTSQAMSPLMAKQFHVPVGEGALVSRVLPNSAAADAKIQAGDVITKIDGKPVLDSRHLHSLTERLDPGKTYPVEIIRDGQRINLNAKAGKLPGQTNSSPRPRRGDTGLNQQPKTFADLGLGVKDATPEQIRQAGIGEGVRGVMIDSVQPNSPAAIAGLQKGMIVERIGNQIVPSVQEFNSTEKNIAANNGAVLYVHTRQGPKFVAVGPDEI